MNRRMGILVYIIAGILLIVAGFVPWMRASATVFGTHYEKALPPIIESRFNVLYGFCLLLYILGLLHYYFMAIFSGFSLLSSIMIITESNIIFTEIFIEIVEDQGVSGIFNINLDAGFWVMIIASILGIIAFFFSKPVKEDENP